MEYKRLYRNLNDEVKKKNSASTKGKPKSYDHKLHISQSMKRYWESVPYMDSADSNKKTEQQPHEI